MRTSLRRRATILGRLLLVLACVLLGGVPAHLAHADAKTAAATQWSDADGFPSVTSDDPTRGDRAAPVTIVVYSDFECPFCKKLVATLDDLERSYGAKKLRVVWKHNPLPFHKRGRPASIAAETVFRLGGSQAFWKWHAKAYENQKDLTDENFASWAKAAGVDKNKFEAAFRADKFAKKVDDDIAEAKQAGVKGTPASFVNGVFLSGAQPKEKFVALIDAELAAAKALGSTVRSDKVYVKLSVANKAKAPPPSTTTTPAKPPDTTTVWKVPVGTSPSRSDGGFPTSALVTVVEFTDFQCPFCGKAQPTLEQLRKEYGKKVRFVWKNRALPFHNRAMPAAIFAMEARAQKGDKGFWAAHDLLFANQKALQDSDLEGYAKRLGLDVAEVKRALAAERHKATLESDMEVAEDFEASGTPHFFINGRRLVGAQPIEAFRTIIDEEVAKAEKLVADGVALSQVYSRLTKDGRTPAPPQKKSVTAPQTKAPSKGDAKAKVTIQVFGDFECPFTKRSLTTLAQVEKDYAGRVRIVWRDKPLAFHKNAALAAEAAREAFRQKGNKGFWAFHDAAFKAQGQSALDRAGLDQIAQAEGLDLGAFGTALDSHSHEPSVTKDSEAADKAGISGTPSFVINDYFLSGAQPYSKFKRVIDLALKESGPKQAAKP